MKKCIKCKHIGFFMGNIFCDNEKTQEEKGKDWANNYVNIYGWDEKLCNNYKKDKR